MAKKSLASLMKNAPNMSKKANELIHNRFILYFVFIIAVANLFHFVFSHDLMSVCVFIVAGLLTSFFSKNMVVIMVISIVVTHVVRFGNGGHEGFESLEEQVKEILDEEEEDDEDEEKEGFKGRRSRPSPDEYTFHRKNGDIITTIKELNDNCTENEKCYLKARGETIPYKHRPVRIYRENGKEIINIKDVHSICKNEKCKYCRDGNCIVSRGKKSTKKTSRNSSGVNKCAIKECEIQKINEIVKQEVAKVVNTEKLL